MRRVARRWRWVLRLAVSLGIITYILVDVDWGDLGRAIVGVDLRWVAAAAGVYVAGQLLSAFKWSLLGRAVGFDLPRSAYTRFYFLGMFFNLFGPSTLGGDVARGLYLAGGRRRGLALQSVVFDRLSGLAVLMGIAAVASLFAGGGFPWLLRAAIVAGGLGIALGWWLAPRLAGVLPEGLRIRTLIEQDLAPFWQDRRLLVGVCVISLAFHLSQVGQQWLLARAAGIELPFAYCLVFHPILSVMMALPFSIGGFGVREGGYLYFLTRIDIDDSIAVTMGLLWWAVTLVGGLIGGVLFLLSGARLPRVRARMQNELEAVSPLRADLPPA